jgi:hypothetical protein
LECFIDIQPDKPEIKYTAAVMLMLCGLVKLSPLKHFELVSSNAVVTSKRAEMIWKNKT